MLPVSENTFQQTFWMRKDKLICIACIFTRSISELFMGRKLCGDDYTSSWMNVTSSRLSLVFRKRGNMLESYSVFCFIPFLLTRSFIHLWYSPWVDSKGQSEYNTTHTPKKVKKKIDSWLNQRTSPHLQPRLAFLEVRVYLNYTFNRHASRGEERRWSRVRTMHWTRQEGTWRRSEQKKVIVRN